MKRVLFMSACFFALIPSIAFADPLAGTPLEGSPIIPTMMEFVPMVITFSILLILMGKFVWPVVLMALDERAEKIEDSLKRAEEAKVEAEDILNEAQQRLAEARKEATAIVETGKTDGELARENIIENAEQEAADIVARGFESVKEERKSMVADMRADSIRLAVNIAGKIFEKELSDDVDEAMVEKAIDEMGSFNE